MHLLKISGKSWQINKIIPNGIHLWAICMVIFWSERTWGIPRVIPQRKKIEMRVRLHVLHFGDGIISHWREHRYTYQFKYHRISGVIEATLSVRLGSWRLLQCWPVRPEFRLTFWLYLTRASDKITWRLSINSYVVVSSNLLDIETSTLMKYICLQECEISKSEHYRVYSTTVLSLHYYHDTYQFDGGVVGGNTNCLG